jgi:hypothetical protein
LIILAKVDLGDGEDHSDDTVDPAMIAQIKEHMKGQVEDIIKETAQDYEINCGESTDNDVLAVCQLCNVSFL